MLTKLGAAVLTSILIGLAPEAWALTATDPGHAADIVDLAEHALSSEDASDAVAALLNADWGATFETWKSQHPDATCQGPDDAPTELLCHICRVPTESGSKEWSFYSLGNEDPPQCRLYQARELFRAFPETFGMPELTKVEKALYARFGSAKYAQSGCETNEEECWKILELLLWEQPNLEILAYRGFGLQTVVQVRSAVLRAARRTNEDGATNMESPRLGVQIEDLVAAELGDRATRFRHALADYSAREEILPELRALLDEAHNVEGPNRYALLLGADVLAERLSYFSTEVPADLPKEVKYGEAVVDEPVPYSHNLVQEVLRDAPEASSAHDLAFLMMLDMGFDPSPFCNAGEDQFHRVVREATAFLSKRPDSKYRADVSYLLAQAYETWWSAAEWGETEEAREGAEAARRRAVELYRQIVRDEPTSDRARFAKFVLPRLMLRAYTGQQRFLCNYGC